VKSLSESESDTRGEVPEEDECRRKIAQRKVGLKNTGNRIVRVQGYMGSSRDVEFMKTRSILDMVLGYLAHKELRHDRCARYCMVFVLYGVS
jgi:hypothetical protein